MVAARTDPKAPSKYARHQPVPGAAREPGTHRASDPDHRRLERQPGVLRRTCACRVADARREEQGLAEHHPLHAQLRARGHRAHRHAAAPGGRTRAASCEGSPRAPARGSCAINWRELRAEIIAARWLGYRVAWLYDQGQVPTAESSMIKVLTAELLARIADLGTDILGWAGLVRGRGAPGRADGILPAQHLVPSGRRRHAGHTAQRHRPVGPRPAARALTRKRSVSPGRNGAKRRPARAGRSKSP